MFIKKEQYSNTNVGWVRNKRERTIIGTSKEEQKDNKMRLITGKALIDSMDIFMHALNSLNTVLLSFLRFKNGIPKEHNVLCLET